MQININEELMTLSDATRYAPRRNGKKVHVSTIYRWSTLGCRGVVLETLQAGSTRVTSREALSRFFARLTADVQGHAVEARTEQAADELRVSQELDAAGI